MGADAPAHPPAGAVSTMGPDAGPTVGVLPPPVVRPPDDRAKRKRNLFIIVAVYLTDRFVFLPMERATTRRFGAAR